VFAAGSHKNPVTSSASLHGRPLRYSKVSQSYPYLRSRLQPPLTAYYCVRYRSAAHAAYTVVREEGFSTLYRGVSLTALRQATNQAVNFTAYTEFKAYTQKLQPHLGEQGLELPAYQHMLLGLASGAMGPLSNAPIDTIKTRLQKQPKVAGESSLTRTLSIATNMWKHEGVHAFYKGITPRIMRVAPGQAVTFMVYEAIRGWMDKVKLFSPPPVEFQE